MMQMWHRKMMYKRMLKNIQIPGNIWVPFLVGLILGTTMVLFIKLHARQPTVATSEESISGRNESLEVIIQLQSGEELQLRATGRTTMEVLKNLKQIEKYLETKRSNEKSYPSMPPQEESTMKRLDNSSSITF